MSLNGAFYTSVAGGDFRLQLEWTATQNIDANTSTITAKLYWMSMNSYATLSASSQNTASISIGAQTTTDTATAGLNGNQKKLIHTASRTITHNADGTASIVFNGFFDVNVTYGGTPINRVNLPERTYDLDTIPRASSLTSSKSWVAGDSVPISIDRASADFNHTLLIRVWNNNVYYEVKRYDNLIYANYTWNPTLDETTLLFNLLNNDSTDYKQETEFILITYNGATEVGRKTYYGALSSPTRTVTSSSMDFTIGDSVPISFTRALSGFTHTLKFYVNATLIHTETGVATSFTWNPTAAEETAMYNALGPTGQPTSKLEIETYYNGEIVRSPSVKTGIVTIPDGEPTFTTIDYLDTNNVVTAITQDAYYIVQNKSTLRAVVWSANKAVGKYGATITKYIAKFNGKSITKDAPFTTDVTFDFGLIDATSNQNLTITAYDSRGATTDVIMTVNIVPWSPPIILSTAKRASGFLDTVSITLSGTISPVKINGVDKNTLVPASVTYETRVTGGTYGAATAFTGQVLTMPNYSATTATATLVNTSSWDVRVTVTDKFGNTQLTLKVAVGKPIMFIDSVKKSIGFNRFPVANDTFEFDNNIDVYGKATTKNGLYADKGYFEVGTYNEASYGTGKMQSFYDGVNKQWRIQAKDASDVTVPLDVLVNGNKVYNVGNLMIATGSVSFPLTAGVANSIGITFGKTFPGIPKVVASIQHSSAGYQTQGVGAGGVTTTGANLYASREAGTGNATVTVNWVAIWEG